MMFASEGGGGLWKRRKVDVETRKVGGVNFNLQISSKCRQGRWGQNIRKICGRL